MIKIRPIEHTDFPAWLPLWDENNQGHRDEAVTSETWARLCNPDFPVHGFVAENKGQIMGLVHYVLHHTTGNIDPICYMQDVYVSPNHRKKGIARKLVKHLATHSKNQKWPRLYWLAAKDNEAAQNLYKTLGVQLDFTLHVLIP